MPSDRPADPPAESFLRPASDRDYSENHRRDRNLDHTDRNSRKSTGTRMNAGTKARVNALENSEAVTEPDRRR